MKKLLLILLSVPLFLYSYSKNKVGISITVEVPIKNILVSLSGNSNDSTFKTALKSAEKKIENNQISFVELFLNEFSDEGNELSSIFGTRDLRDKIQGKNNTESMEVIKSEVNDIVESSLIILQKRINNFSFGMNANISRTEILNRVIIDFPKGLENSEINRIKSLLKSQPKLELWETFEFLELFDDILLANSYLVNSKEFVKDSTNNNSNPNSNEYPWFSVCSIPQVSQKKGPIIGYVALNDTAIVNSYINDDGFMSNFNPDLKFAFAPNHLDDSNESFVLLALKKKGSKGYVMDGDVITGANSFIDWGQVCVSIDLNVKGSSLLKTITAKNIGRSLAIVLDGYVISWPVVGDEIVGGRTKITGNFTVNEGKDLANMLSSGKLTTSFDILNVRELNN